MKQKDVKAYQNDEVTVAIISTRTFLSEGLAVEKAIELLKIRYYQIFGRGYK